MQEEDVEYIKQHKIQDIIMVLKSKTNLESRFEEREIHREGSDECNFDGEIQRVYLYESEIK